MAKKMYNIDLKIINKADAPNGFFYHPDIPDGLSNYEIRHFNTNSMKCKIYIDENVDIPSKQEITAQAWSDLEA